MGRSTRVGRYSWVAGLASAMGLAALVAGIPLLLASQGELPHWHQVVQAVDHPGGLVDLRRPVSDNALGGLLAAVAWSSWAYLVVCVLLDLVARSLGRSPVRVPGMQRTQALLAGLIGASLALMPLSRGFHIRLLPATAPVSAFLPLPSPPPSVATTGFDSSLPEAPTSPTASPSVDAAEADVEAPAVGATERIYVVQPGDTLWAIAESELGSPLRWPEIGDRNRGLPQPGGEALTDDNWLLPGWRLLLPVAGSPVPDAMPQVRGDAEEAPSSAPALSEDEAVMSQTSGSRIREITASAAGTTSDDLSTSVARGAPPPRSGPARHSVPAPIVPVGFGLMGAAVIALLARMRRAQQRRRPEGLRIRLPEPTLVDLERDLRVAANPDLLGDLHCALRLLREATDTAGSRPLPIVAARCRPDGIEFVLHESAMATPALPPFVSSATGGSWCLPGAWLRGEGRARLAQLAHVDVALPALVTVAADEETTLLVDLEQMGSLSSSGRDASMMLQGMVVELCTLPWAEGVDVVVVGDHGDLRSLDRARRSASVAALIPDVRRRVAAQHAMAAAHGSASVSAARWSAQDPCWDPLVIICFGEAAAAEPEAVRHLVSLAGDGSSGVAVVVGVDGVGARWSVVADGGPVILRAAAEGDDVGAPGPDHIFVDAGMVPHRGPPDLLRRVDALLESAGSDAPMTGLGEARDAGVAGATDRRRSGEAEVRVLVLGPVRVIGAERSFTRAWSLDLVVYLAMHPEGASTERWAEALWPDRVMAPASLHSTASAARRALGISAAGDDHLPRAHGRLALGPSVTSDWQEFQELAVSVDPTDWERALRLVRGSPFEGLRAIDWTVLDGTIAGIEATVVDVACRIARRALENDDPALAEWSARQALLVARYDERLFRLLLLAADTAGNPAGVEKAMSELLKVVDDVEPYDAVHPETLELYKSLSRRGSNGRGAGP